MKISVIMPSYLSPLKTSGRNLENKFIRAVKSVKDQSYQDWELIIVADGCEKTVLIYNQCFVDSKIKLIYSLKQPPFSGMIRNCGLDIASGDVVCYLDADDCFGTDHLKNIATGIKDNQWVWFDDFSYKPDLAVFQQRRCNIHQAYQHGTSNIAHRRDLSVNWPGVNQYGHDDMMFIRILRRTYQKYEKIEGGQYYVCHVPKNNQQPFYDV